MGDSFGLEFSKGSSMIDANSIDNAGNDQSNSSASMRVDLSRNLSNKQRWELLEAAETAFANGQGLFLK